MESILVRVAGGSGIFPSPVPPQGALANSVPTSF